MTTCAHCGKPLPKLAILHEDPYCSNSCARQAYGVSFTAGGLKRERACIGCGGEMDETTPGCEQCRKRHTYRRHIQEVAA